MQVFQKGPFRVVVEHGDDDPPAPDEFEVALRFKPSEVGGILSKITTAEQGYEALHRIETTITEHLGKLAPEIRDAIRNEVAFRVPGLPDVLKWSKR